MTTIGGNKAGHYLEALFEKYLSILQIPKFGLAIFVILQSNAVWGQSQKEYIYLDGRLIAVENGNSPNISITSPASDDTYTSTQPSIALGGTASPSASLITWANNRGGSGSCSGTTSWSCEGIMLQNGTNVLTATAYDAANNSSSDMLIVTYELNVSIHTPTTSDTYSTSQETLILGGIASTGVTQVTWANDRGGSGSCSGTASWSCSGIALQTAVTMITVTAQDAASNTGSDTLTVTYTPSADTQPPSIAITSPTSEASYSTTSNLINLSGTAGDNIGIAQITWANNTGGNGYDSGSASWTFNGIVLQDGVNILTVTAFDAAGNNSSDTLMVSYTSPLDTEPPSIAITEPTSFSSFTTTSNLINLSGTANDNTAVTQVSWVNGQINGNCMGTDAWTCSGIGLLSGTNLVVVSASDAANNISTDYIFVIYYPPGQIPTPSLSTVYVPGYGILLSWGWGTIPPYQAYQIEVEKRIGEIDPIPGDEYSYYWDSDYIVGKAYAYRIRGVDSEMNKGPVSNWSIAVTQDPMTLIDKAVWRPGTGEWRAKTTDDPPQIKTVAMGAAGDIPLLGDFDANGTPDIAIYNPSTGIWSIRLSLEQNGTVTTTQWGLPSDIPVPGDYDGDLQTDVAVWRPSDGNWYILPSTAPGSYTVFNWGLSGDIPAPADYDGDLKTDIGVWRLSDGTWYLLASTEPGTYTATQWGLTGDIPVPCDYDGDDKSDIAVYRPGVGVWYVLPSSTPGIYTTTYWGISDDIPVPADYDRDRKSDIAVWRPSNGTWYIIPSSSPPGTYTSDQFGQDGDVPLAGH